MPVSETRDESQALLSCGLQTQHVYDTIRVRLCTGQWVIYIQGVRVQSSGYDICTVHSLSISPGLWTSWVRSLCTTWCKIKSLTAFVPVAAVACVPVAIHVPGPPLSVAGAPAVSCLSVVRIVLLCCVISFLVLTIRLRNRILGCVSDCVCLIQLHSCVCVWAVAAGVCGSVSVRAGRVVL